jgi:hypothetical protein
MGKLTAQTELFTADTTWFHVFHSLLKGKAWAAMSAPAKIVYITAKAFVNWRTGAAFPSLDTLAEYSGLSRPAITKGLKELEKLGHIRAKKTAGKKTVYTVLERLPITGQDGRPAAVATFDYLPGMVREAVAELKNVLVTGELADGKHIHIETLNLTVNIAGHNNIAGNQTVVDVDGLVELRKIREMIDRGDFKEVSERVHKLTDDADREG